MASYAWVLEVRPGYEELYKLRHDAIWPEMLAELRVGGIRNYNIFRYGLTLFGYFETDDLEETKSRLSKSAINAKWSKCFLCVILCVTLAIYKGAAPSGSFI